MLWWIWNFFVHGFKTGKNEYTVEKTCCVECNKYRNFLTPKMYIFSKALVFLLIITITYLKKKKVLRH